MNCKWSFCSKVFVVPENSRLRRFVAKMTVDNADPCRPLPKFAATIAIYRATGEDQCDNVVFVRTKAKLRFSYVPDTARHSVTLTHFLRCDIHLCLGDSLKFQVHNIRCVEDGCNNDDRQHSRLRTACPSSSDSDDDEDSNNSNRKNKRRPRQRGEKYAICKFIANMEVQTTWELCAFS